MNKYDRRFLNWVFESTSVVIIFVLIGNALDKKFQTGAQIVSLALLLTFALEGWNLYKIIKQSSENKGNKK